MKAHTSLPIQTSFPRASQLIYGCMGLGGGWNTDPVSTNDIKHTQAVIEAALEEGITVFDHADIYTFGKAEIAFGECLKRAPELRDQMVIQSKCGIRFADEKGPKRYDFSATWIEQSVDGILRRLNIEQLDVLLLHRPDPLMDVVETTEILRKLISIGKIKQIGVSNMQSAQISFMQKYLDLPIVANQIEMSLLQCDWLEESLTTGSTSARDNSFDSHLLTYCTENNLQMQAWGSLAQGKLSSEERAQNTSQRAAAAKIKALGEKYECSPEAIVLAWLMRLPNAIQPIIGTTNLARIRACAEAVNIRLSREDWYALYQESRGQEVP
ncbi:aldo/keto reductase [Alteromonas flava]|uniref:aldo/keto reductase n=1 Tax=Alteromonas flava TaxID=2048003 RepID=UPI00196B2382|nr:aldo/keto reductase [Alteromonas flava]